MELLKSLSDDQIALLGCMIALLSTGTLMSLSYYLGRGRIPSAVESPLASPVRISGLTGEVSHRRDAA